MYSPIVNSFTVGQLLFYSGCREADCEGQRVVLLRYVRWRISAVLGRNCEDTVGRRLETSATWEHPIRTHNAPTTHPQRDANQCRTATECELMFLSMSFAMGQVMGKQFSRVLAKQLLGVYTSPAELH